MRIEILAVGLVLLVVLVVVVGVLWLYPSGREETFEVARIEGINNTLKSVENPEYTASGVPKIIWSFWDSLIIPELVHLCVESWKKSNPDYTIHFLTYETYSDYIDLDESPNFRDNHARFSDLLRLSLLHKYGGVWIDASVIVNKSLDEWLEAGEYDMFAYCQAGKSTSSPHIESWLVAAPKQTHFIALWLREFLTLKNMSALQYVKSLRRMGVEFEGLGDYHAAYFSYRKVIEVDGASLDRVHLTPADTETGPYSCHTKADWSSPEIARLLLAGDACRGPIVKLVKADRKALMKRNYKELFERARAI